MSAPRPAEPAVPRGELSSPAKPDLLKSPQPDADREFFLLLPQAAFDRGHLAQGDIVSARRQRYGLEFTSAGARQAFFLVVDDDAFRELQTYPVVL